MPGFDYCFILAPRVQLMRAAFSLASTVQVFHHRHHSQAKEARLLRPQGVSAHRFAELHGQALRKDDRQTDAV